MLADGAASSSVTLPGAPQFAEFIRNVTVPLGREAVLSCVINNLAEYKVSLAEKSVHLSVFPHIYLRYLFTCP